MNGNSMSVASNKGGIGTTDLRFIPVFQGETRVSSNESEVMTTILGSCVAACVWDPTVGVGGLNHFLLPGQDSDRGKNLRYGVNAMELLINGLLKQGADRQRLRAKLIGGAKMIDGRASIGSKNAEFAIWYMETEGISVIGECLGGQRGRKIRFWPKTGRMQRSFLDAIDSCDMQYQTEVGQMAKASIPQEQSETTLF